MGRMLRVTLVFLEDEAGCVNPTSTCKMEVRFAVLATYIYYIIAALIVYIIAKSMEYSITRRLHLEYVYEEYNCNSL
jgi:hypothetical protein